MLRRQGLAAIIAAMLVLLCLQGCARMSPESLESLEKLKAEKQVQLRRLERTIQDFPVLVKTNGELTKKLRTLVREKKALRQRIDAGRGGAR